MVPKGNPQQRTSRRQSLAEKQKDVFDAVKLVKELEVEAEKVKLQSEALDVEINVSRRKNTSILQVFIK